MTHQTPLMTEYSRQADTMDLQQVSASVEKLFQQTSDDHQTTWEYLQQILRRLDQIEKKTVAKR